MINLARRFLLFLFGFSLPVVSALASPQSFTLQGQIIKPDDTVLDAASVDYTVQIFTSDGNECLLYEEAFNSVNMSNSNGLFALEVGKGTRTAGSFHGESTLAQIFDNASVALTGLTCGTGSTYTPGATDQRQVRITFNDGSGAVTITQDHKVNSVPYAQYANSVGGLEPNEILIVNSTKALTQANLESIFNAGSDVTELRSLIDGSSSNYIVSSPSATVDFNNQRVTNVAAPTAATDAANKNYVDSKIGGQDVDTADLGALGAVETGEVLTWNGSQWDSQRLSTVDNTKLPLAGGTMTGAINMGNQDITNIKDIITSGGVTVGGGIGVTSGINSGGNIALQAASQVQFQDAADGEYIAFKAPATVTANVTFTLPDGDGIASQVLSTDGAGNLIWANDANSDAVASVFGRTGTVTCR